MQKFIYADRILSSSLQRNLGTAVISTTHANTTHINTAPGSPELRGLQLRVCSGVLPSVPPGLSNPAGCDLASEDHTTFLGFARETGDRQT